MKTLTDVFSVLNIVEKISWDKQISFDLSSEI